MKGISMGQMRQNMQKRRTVKIIIISTTNHLNGAIIIVSMSTNTLTWWQWTNFHSWCRERALIIVLMIVGGWFLPRRNKISDIFQTNTCKSPCKALHCFSLLICVPRNTIVLATVASFDDCPIDTIYSINLIFTLNERSLYANFSLI